MPATRPTRRIHRRIRLPAVAGLLTAALLIAGCGGASHPQVASLGGSSGHSTSKSSAVANQGIPDPDGRPRESLDDTFAQVNALNKPFSHCVGPYHGPYSAFLKRAAKCIRLLPLPPWQYDPVNPQARAFIGSTVSCLQAEHYHVKAYLYQPAKPFSAIWDVVGTSSHGLFGFGPGESRTRKALDACQQQALR